MAKRARHTYSNTQVVELEKEFHTTQYLSRARREELSRDLRLSERQIKIWFQVSAAFFFPFHQGSSRAEQG